jgi:predicted esterase YcpF (UPF0227 family)
MIKKIVYLHGLESKAGGPKVDFLATKGLVYAPKMDFKTLDLYDLMGKIGKPDLIIGSSMGGYVADILGSHLGVDVLLFNPALHSRSIEIDSDGEIYGDKKYKRTIILGTEDDVINPKMTKNIRPKYDNSAKFEEIEGMGHRTSLDVFINMYNKHA